MTTGTSPHPPIVWRDQRLAERSVGYAPRRFDFRGRTIHPGLSDWAAAMPAGASTYSAAPEVVGKGRTDIKTQRKPSKALERRAFSRKREGLQRLASISTDDEGVDTDVKPL